MDRDYLDEAFMAAAGPFIERAKQSESFNLRVAALNCARHVFADYTDDLYYKDLLKVMNLPEGREAFFEREGNLFLVDLKMGTHWVVKVANLELMLRYIDGQSDAGSVMHLGTHLTNLLKVSEFHLPSAAARRQQPAQDRLEHDLCPAQRTDGRTVQRPGNRRPADF